MAGLLLWQNPLRLAPTLRSDTAKPKISRLGPGKTSVQFTEVGVQRTRWDFFGAGAGLHFVALTVLAWMPVVFVRAEPPAAKFETIPILTHPLSEYLPPPPPPPSKFMKDIDPPRPKVVRQPMPEPLPEPKRAVVFETRAAVRHVPRPVDPVDAPNVNAANTPTKLEQISNQKGPRRPLPPVQTGMLESTGSSAVPTLTNRRIETVQTGGFGDPNGVPDNGRLDRAANINRKGSWDLPSGPGVGNGTGGARGAQGTVASAGFGRGVAVAGSGKPSRGGEVQRTSFGDAAPVASTGNDAPRRSASSEAVVTPVEILAKPRPEYTDEARRLKIEGDVKLRVLFAANGELRVLGMVQGLGHGLDEAALAAAQKIRFRPARAGNQPVDLQANITIEFRLAY